MRGIFLIFSSSICPFCLPTRPFYEGRLASCLRALAEPSTPAAVVDVAVHLAVQHALAHGIGECLLARLLFL